MIVVRAVCRVVGTVVLGIGLLKVVDPAAGSSFGAWGTGATLVELALGVALWVPGAARPAAWSLLVMSLLYASVVVTLAMSRYPISHCGCLGASLRLGIGAHLVVLGILGLLACLCIRLLRRDAAHGGPRREQGA